MESGEQRKINQSVANSTATGAGASPKLSRPHHPRHGVTSTDRFATSVSRTLLAQCSSVTALEVVDPVDFEESLLLQRKSGILEKESANSSRSFSDYPPDDVQAKILPRNSRFLDSTISETLFAEGKLDPHVKDCLSAYSQNSLVVGRKYQQHSTGSSYRVHVHQRPVLADALSRQLYEVDVEDARTFGDAFEGAELRSRSSFASVASDSTSCSTGTGTTESGTLYSRTGCRNSCAQDLEHSSGDALIPNVADRLDPQVLEMKNEEQRQQNRHKCLFSLYPLQNEEEVIEYKDHAAALVEPQGHRLLVKVLQLKLEFEFEPIFASMALYDAKERKKVSENFYFDVNSELIKGMLKAHVPFQDLSTMSRSAVFNITYPSTDLYLVIKLERVLQPGGTDNVDAYTKEDKKLKSQALEWCERLGAYRMPFAWTAVYLFNVFSGSNTLESCASSDTGDTDSIGSATLERRTKMSSSMRHATHSTTTTDSSPLMRKSSVSGATTAMTATSRTSTTNAAVLEELGLQMDSFKPTTITLNNFYKQESDRLSDDDLFRMLVDVKKPSILSKKLKCISGIVKLDVAPCPPKLENCLSPELLRIRPYPNLESRPTKEVLEFPSKEIFVPHFLYRDLLYVFSKTVNFSSRLGSARNIAIQVQLMSGEKPDTALPVIFGKSGCPEFSSHCFSAVNYHNKSPVFYDEMKLKLPPDLNEKHHLLFTFYHVSCKPKQSGASEASTPHQSQHDSVIGFTWLPLLKDGGLQTGEFGLPIALEPLPESYSYLSPDVNLPNMKWLDNHKRVFTVTIEAVSSVHPQVSIVNTHRGGQFCGGNGVLLALRSMLLDPFISSFLQLYHYASSSGAKLSGKTYADAATFQQDFRRSIQHLTKARPEPLVKFLYVILDKLIDLMVNPPTVMGEQVNLGQTCFEMLGQLVKILTFLLDNCGDQHGRSSLLTTYIQYACRLPQTGKQATIISSSGRTSLDRSGHLRAVDASRMGSSSRLVHEELLSHWIQSSGAAREMATANSWFFTELLAKSMAEYLSTSSRLYLPRRLRFSERFSDDLTTLFGILTVEVITRSSRDFRVAQIINNSLGFFVCELLFLVDRSFVFGLIKIYCKYLTAKFVGLQEGYNTLMLLKLEFLRIVTSHEHFVTLNLPLLQLSGTRASFDLVPQSLPTYTGPSTTNLPSLTAQAQDQSSPSPTPSTASRTSVNSSSCGQLSSRDSICTGSGSIGAAELTLEFRSRHYLLGLVLADLAVVLDGKSSVLHQKAINVVRNLLTCHDLDPRYVADNNIRTIASLYLPLVGLVLDSCSQLCDPYAKHRPGTAASARNSVFLDEPAQKLTVLDPNSADASVNPAVAMAIAVGTVPSNICQADAAGLFGLDQKKTCFTLEASRCLLVCFCWVLKNLNRQQLKQWLTELSQTRLAQLLDVLQLCISCFEYRGLGVLSQRTGTDTSDCATSTSLRCNNKSLRLRSKLEEALIGGQNLRTEFMSSRKAAGGGALSTAATGSNQSTPTVGVRWRKDQIQFRQTREHHEKLKPEMENDAITEGNLATEISLIVLDVLEALVHSLSQSSTGGAPLGVLSWLVRVILHMLCTNQSVQVLQNLFASQRALVANYPWLIFEDDTEQCSDLCMYLLQHCASPIADIRSQSAASLYLLMRQSFETGANFARVKMQITVSLSSLVGSGRPINEDCLRRSLKTILTYAEQDFYGAGTEPPGDTTFADQVKDLGFNLHMILSDTVKMKEHQHDFEMLIDLMYRIAKGYQNSPDLRLTWLQSIAQKHLERHNYAEAAECIVHATALVAEYMNMIEDVTYRPAGCVAFLPLSENVLEESAVSDDIVSPEEEGICESRYFSEAGFCALLEQMAQYFELAQMYETVHEVYKLYIPILQHHRNYKKITEVYTKLAGVLSKVSEKRIFGTFYRVVLYGSRFGDLDGVEYIYKEPAITKLPEISHRLESFYTQLFGQGCVEVVKHSNTVDRAALNPEKAYIQITFVEPYFDRWELRYRPTYFERHVQLRRFMYATPFTMDGRNHGDLISQYKRKTILTTAQSFPYVKTRVQVVHREQLVLSPIEVAIEDLQKKTLELAAATGQNPPDSKMLQMVLQGCIGTTVNQGPMEVANVFLAPAAVGSDPNNIQLDKHQHKLRLCFKDFSKKCADALRENKQLIGADQKEYQRELERNYVSFTEKLAPMVTAAPLACDTIRRHHHRRSEPPQSTDQGPSHI